MFQRINFYNIIKDHLKTLRRIDIVQNRMATEDLILFFIAPMMVAGLLSYYNISIKNHVTDFVTAVSILGGFLFNLLAIIYGLMDKIESDTPNLPAPTLENDIKKLFIKQVHVNISFNILISLFLLISLLAYSYLPESHCNKWLLGTYYSLTATIYFLLSIFFLTMLMILNRIYILLKKDQTSAP